MRLSNLAAIALVTACSGSPQRSRPVRVVSVSKQINEYLYDIGADSVIVGRDLTSVYPPAITSKPSVGYHRALSAEGIISMRPTLFLTDGNVGPEPVIAQVRKSGIPVAVMEPGRTVESAQQLMTALGERFGRRSAADSVVAAWRSDMDSLWRDTTRWAAAAARPRVLIIHFGQIANDYLALKRGGAADAMLGWAGAENAIDSVGGMARLTPELIARAAPDIIVATDVGFDRYGSVAKFTELPGVALTPAGRSGRIHRIQEQELMYFGPRTPATVRRLAEWFHADAGTVHAAHAAHAADRHAAAAR